MLAFTGALLWKMSAAASQSAETNSWALTSPKSSCEIRVFLDSDGRLSYEALRDGKVVIRGSPLGLRCNDQDFESELSLDHAGKSYHQREKYELFAGVQPKVNHLLNHRRLTFRNNRGARLEIDLAASDEGVAFRYCFAETNSAVRIAEAELTGFSLPMNALGWLQPYHAAGPYTPAYEDFYFHVSPGDPPPNSRKKAVGWAFPALFHVPDADTWALVTESGTDGSFCGCHLNPDSTGGLYRVAFALADEGTRGHVNQFGPEPRCALPWTMPWRVIVLSQSATSIATQTLVTDLAPPSRVSDVSWIQARSSLVGLVVLPSRADDRKAVR